MSDRSSGILTPTDREFLQSEGPYYDGENARQSRYDRRRGIRRRIVGSILDFQEIAAGLEDEQRRKIFANPEENGAENSVAFNAALESMFRWIYLGCREEGPDFEALIRQAIIRGEEDYHRIRGGNIVDVEVDLDINVSKQHSGVAELGQALEEGEPVLARSIYKLPMIEEVPVDPEKVDVVRILPEGSQKRPDREKKMIKTILKEHLGIDAEIEISGLAEMDLSDELTKEKEKTAAVPPEEYTEL
jgi:hypothetical protein